MKAGGGSASATNAAARRHFEAAAAGYTRLRGRGINGWMRRQEQRAVAELARLEVGARVLDAGCGDGEILAWATSCGARAFGFDLAAPMALQCRARGLNVCVQDMEEVGFRTAFDWVLCIGSLEFTGAPARAMEELSRSLRRSGRLVLLYPRRSVLARVYARYHRRHGVPIRLFDRAQITELTRGAGLEPRAWRDCLLSSVCMAEKVRETP